ncbi:MAG: DNA polymerase/3'-5' exonuclease PolX [Planctomycetota bacterium]|nr:DNA polymerase/3'-5' exonuclease PolX [Planctomycetota bacterium]
MQNIEIARLFEELADLLELQGANAFRLRAYRNAARTLASLPEAVSELAESGAKSLQKIPGIGKDLAEKLVAVVETGELPQLEELRQQIPVGVVMMLRIPGIGPKKVAAIFNELGLTTLDQLREAAEMGQIAELKGFGARTATTILEGLDQVEQSAQRVYHADARPVVEQIIRSLQSLESVTQVSAAGSFRRCLETVGDLDVLVTSTDSAQAMDALAQHPLVEKVLARGETKQRVRLSPVFDGIKKLELDLRVVPDESYGAAMQYFTGSKEHNIVIRRRAQELGLKVNEYGVFRDQEYVAGRTEEDVYAALGLPFIAPELRENRREFELASAGTLPELITVDDVLGDLHMHTTATDGQASILEMAEAAKTRGLKYIAITDHSKRVTMANGLDSKRLRAHWKNIEKARSEISGIEILCGIECDILEDATMDLPDDVLAEADWVVAVLHYGLKQPRDQINKRLLTAIRNPHVSAIGHPSGRVIGKRPGADISFNEIFQAAADHGCMMEINAHRSRLDLDDVHAAAAKDFGIPIVVSTDAHSVHGFGELQNGINQARRAGLTRQDVANTRTFNEFQNLIR